MPPTDPDATQLSPEGLRVEPHPRVALRTPGLSGQVKVHEARAPGSRGPEDVREAFVVAMAHNHLVEDLTLEITEQREVTPAEGSRAAGGPDDIVLEVRDPGAGFAQFVLYESEDGVLSWHLPEEGLPAQRTTRGGGTLTYRVPRVVERPAPAADSEGPAQRGVLGAVGKKILKVIAFRLVRAGATWVGERYGEKIELALRPHRLRTFLPGEHRAASPAEVTDDQLRALGSGRALLFVHGTFSTAHQGFGNLPDADLAALHERYGGRVLALDHPTVSVSPVDNIAWLGQRLAAAGVSLDVDLVAHSRGGLVCRVLTERPELAQLATDRVRVGRLVMVGTPNAGTALADVAHLEQLLNRFTTLLQLVPDNGVTDVLDILLAVLKQVAAGVAEGLEGLMSMNPKGRFLTTQLNVGTATPTRYFAAAANFEPPGGSPLLRIAQDAGVDLVFGKADNDLVVPTRGVFELGEAGGAFPIEERIVFDEADAVDHCGYWTRPAFTERLHEWLPVEP